MSYILGVTGGIGSGKSTVCSILSDIGWYVVDFDLIAAQVLERENVKKELYSIFGRDVFDSQGRVNRRMISLEIFSDSDKRAKLESLVHPIVEREAFDQAKKAEDAGNSFIAFDCPLLIEKGLWSKVNWVLVVVAPEALRIKRASEKLGITEDEVLKRMRAQMDDKKRTYYADFVVENDGSLEDLRRKIAEISKKIKQEVGYDNP